MKRIKTGSFKAFLDSGDTCEVVYSSEYVSRGFYINEIVSCTFQGVDITAVFRYNQGCTDIPFSIWKAIENNAEYLWDEKIEFLN